MKEIEAEPRAPVGADLVIPALSLAFAAYFFLSITDLAWEAKANGVFIGSALVVLVLVHLARLAWQVAQRRASLAFSPLTEPRDLLRQRIALVAITAAFIASLQWLGVTLALFIALYASLRVLGIRRQKVLFLVSGITALSVYVLFIAILDSAFVHGPVEHLFSWLAGFVQ